MKALPGVLLLVVSLMVGCGKSQNAPANNSSSVSPLNAPAEYGAALANGQNAALKTVDIASLNQAIQMFNVTEGRFPKDLNELVDHKLIAKIPDAPRGQKLQYDATTGIISMVAAQ